MNSKLVVIIYSNKFSDFESLRKHLVQLNLRQENIVFCDSKINSRIDMIDQYKKTWLYFLDSDCYPVPQTLKLIEELANNNNENSCVVSGLYQNPVKSRYFQKVQNKISNLWLSISYELNYKYKNLLGGNFLVFNNVNQKLANEEAVKLFWGAEDLHLGHILADNKFIFSKNDKLVVEHRTSSALSHFIRRAWLHGRNEVKYIDQNKMSSNSIKYFAWLRKFDFQDLFLIPAIFLHFCIQKLAKLTQIALQVRRTTK